MVKDYKQATYKELSKMYEGMEVSRNICLNTLLDIRDMCYHTDVLESKVVKKTIDKAIRGA